MKTLLVFLAVIPLTATAWTIPQSVMAECQPDPYGNVIDLGNGNCQKFVQPNPQPQPQQMQ